MKLTVKKINSYQFNHQHGKQSGAGWGIANEAGEFLTFDSGEYPMPYTPAGGKNTAQLVANTITIDSTTIWVKPLA